MSSTIDQTSPAEGILDYPEALAEARRIADALGTLTAHWAPSDVVMACCILIHRMEPGGDNLASFARKMLEDGAWVDG